MQNLRAFTVVVAAALMGSLSIFVRNLPLHPVQLAFFRIFIAFLFLALFIAIKRKGVVIREPKIIAGLVIVNTLTIASYIAAIQIVEVATAALLLYMAPIYVIPIAHLTGEQIEGYTWIALPLGILGLYFMLSPYGTLSLGLICGLVSGMSYAAFFILIKKARAVMSALHITFIYLGFASLLLSPSLFLFPLQEVNPFWLIGLGLIPTAIAFTLFSYGIKYCRVEQAPLFALVEPVTAGIFGFIVFSEVFGLKQLFGAILILISVALAWRY
jgi:drug/metabolite transporter (DMT)-like permease